MHTTLCIPGVVALRFPVLRFRLLAQGRRSERGVALIITLNNLALFNALSLGMVITFSSQTLIGGYNRKYRGAFYAADSGLNVARQQVQSLILAGVPVAWANPLHVTNPTGLASTCASSMTSNYGSSTTLNTGTAAQSWAESFKVTGTTLTLAPGWPVVTAWNTSTGGCTAVLPCPTGYQYLYKCSINVAGSAQGSEQQAVTETGSFTLNITGQAAATNVNFAFFGGFVDMYPPGLGPLIPGTMSGPMFTNSSWEFMANQPPWTSARYVFTDPIESPGWHPSRLLGYELDPGIWVAGPSAGVLEPKHGLHRPSSRACFLRSGLTCRLPIEQFQSGRSQVVDGFGNGYLSPATTTSDLTTLTKCQQPALRRDPHALPRHLLQQGNLGECLGKFPAEYLRYV